MPELKHRIEMIVNGEPCAVDAKPYGHCAESSGRSLDWREQVLDADRSLCRDAPVAAFVSAPVPMTARKAESIMISRNLDTEVPEKTGLAAARKPDLDSVFERRPSSSCGPLGPGQESHSQGK